tara:strand:+ start:766 stop:1047 length:282 start_codon:yes stop_codon:yes gene_type:complete
MAAVAGINSAHATLAAATADTVTLSGSSMLAGEIVNHGTDTIYFRLDGVTAVSGADENEVLLSQERLSIRFPQDGSISVISSGTPTYSVIVTG